LEDLDNSLAPQKEHPSSSTWILEHPKYLQWLAGENDRLWIHGKSGSGKTVLAAVIVDDLYRRPGVLASDGQRAREYIGYVFCRDQTKCTALAVMKILASQLLDQLPQSSLRSEQKLEILLEWRETWNPEGTPAANPLTIEKCLLQLIELVLQSFRGVYLVVDGVDDCKEPEKVVKEVQKFCAGASQICKLHVLFVSQKVSQLVETIPQYFQQIDLNDHDIRQKSDCDIRIVTRDILSRSKDVGLISLTTEVTEMIIERSDGMILWATLAARHLLQKISFLDPCNLETIGTTIEQLPPDIGNLYAHLFQRCFADQQETGMYTKTLNILRWVLWSTRPLTVMELDVALHPNKLEDFSTDHNSSEGLRTERLRVHIYTFCCPLISIQQDDTVTAVHLTFRYFVQQWKRLDSPIHQLVYQLSETQSSLVMAASCLQYLNNPQFQQFQILFDDIADSLALSEQYCFFDYAVFGWIYHWGKDLVSGEVQPTLMQLFHALSSGEQGLTWLERYRILTDMNINILPGLQASVNRLTQSSGDKQWLLKLLERSKARKHAIFGYRVSSAIRYTAIALASLYHDAGFTGEAGNLYTSILTGAKSEMKNNLDVIDTMNNLALVQLTEGNFTDAEANMKAVVTVKEQKFGGNSLETTTALQNMAAVYCRQRRFKEAETLLQRVIKIRTAKLGKYHRNTVISKNNINQVYSALGHFTEAKNLLVDLLERFPQKSTSDTLTFLTLKHNLATIYCNLGNYTESEKTEREVLQQRTTLLGDTHENTLMTLNNLVVIYIMQGKYRDAEKLGRQGLEKSMKVFGSKNLHTLFQQNNLASALKFLRQFEESRKLHAMTYQARLEILGQQHFDTLTSLNHLAGLNTEQGNYAKAEEQSAQVLCSLTLLDGPESPSTLNAISLLASLSFGQGRYTMAAELQARILERQRRVLGRFHPDTILSLVVLGAYKKELGLWNKSEELLREAITIAPKAWTPTHADYLGIKRNLGQNYRLLGQLDKAESMLVPLVKISKNSLGEKSPLAAFAMVDLAATWFDQGRYKDSLQLAEEVLDIRKSVLREGDPTLLNAQRLIGRLYHVQGNIKNAEEMMQTTLKQMKNVWGEKHPVPLHTSRFLASVLKSKGDLYQAETLLVSTIEASIDRPGFWHPSTLSSIDDLSMLYLVKRCHPEALELQNIVLEARRKLFGSIHPDSLQSELNLKKISSDKELPLSLTEKVFSLMPKWTGGYAKDPRPLLDIVRSASRRDYHAWLLSYTAQEMDLVLGPDQWESVESRRQVALYAFDHGDFTRSVEPITLSWLKHQEVFGTTDSRTLARFFEVSKCWAALGVLVEKLRQEYPFALSWAVKAGDEQLVRFLLEAEVDPDQPDEDGHTPLFHAATIDRPTSTALVRQLLEAGASTEWTSGSLTILHSAAKTNRPHILGLLLDYNADIDALCPEGHTPLFYACSEGHLGIVKRLLNAKQKPILDLVGSSTIIPLHIAVYHGFLQIVEILLDKGAEIEAISIGLKPLQLAMENGKGKMLKYLLSRGASPNSFGREPFAIHTAAKKGYRDMLHIVLDFKVDVDSQDVQGRTAIFWAACNGHGIILDDLLAKRGDPSISHVSGLTPFHMAASKGHINILKRLLDLSRSNLSTTTKVGWTPLHVTAEGASLEAVQFLLSSSADPNIATAPSTVLQEAIIARSLEVVESVLAAGVDINAQSRRGFTALDTAVQTNQIEMVDFLLQHGAKSGNRIMLEVTALHIATEVNNIPITKRLLQEKTTEIDAQAAHGLTSLHLASGKGHLNMVKLLLREGADANLTDSFGGTALSYAVRAFADDVVSVLLPLTQNPLSLDCFGRSCPDWASFIPSTFGQLGKWTESFVPTNELVQKSHLGKSIVRLTTDLMLSHEERDYGYPFLGRCLFFMGDVDRAEHAYQVFIQHGDEDSPIEHIDDCDACEPKSSIKGDLFVCLVCPLRGLCTACMDKYTQGSAQPKGCVQHDYHRISGRKWRLQAGSSSGYSGLISGKGQSLSEWLMEIKLSYSEKGGRRSSNS
jgi:ankyrin repeat protein/tetratricopeptide (TPR) repeat protein